MYCLAESNENSGFVTLRGCPGQLKELTQGDEEADSAMGDESFDFGSQSVL